MASRGERRGNSARRMTVTAALAALALALSYLEFLLPLEAVIPLPGVKLGLANIAVTLALVLVSPWAAASVSLLRVVLAALLFGTPVSFALSLGGAAAALIMMLGLYWGRAGRKMSYIGLSAACAAAHSAGQIAAACLIFRTGKIIGYLPVLLLFSALTGTLTGLLMNLSVPQIEKAARSSGFWGS